MNYKYKMIQVPKTISIDSQTEQGFEAAKYLFEVVDKHAGSGWEFYRVDSLGVVAQPGCFAALFGRSASTSVHYVVTFRKEDP